MPDPVPLEEPSKAHASLAMEGSPAKVAEGIVGLGAASMGIGDGLKKEAQAWIRTLMQIGAMGLVAFWCQNLLNDLRDDRKYDREQAVKTQDTHAKQFEASREANDKRIELLRSADERRTDKLVEGLNAVRSAVDENTRVIERIGRDAAGELKKGKGIPD